MNDWWQMLIVFFIAANPAGAAAGFALLRPHVDVDRLRPRILGAALATSGLILLLAVLLAEPLLDVLDVQHPTFRIGAGIVLLAAAVQIVVRGHAGFRQLESGWKAGIYPLGLPLVGNPAVIALALTWSADPDAGGWQTLLLGIPAIVVAAGVATIAPAGYAKQLSAIARLLAVVLAMAAGAFVVIGVQTV